MKALTFNATASRPRSGLPTFPEQAKDALAYLAQGRAKGKVVVQMR